MKAEGTPDRLVPHRVFEGNRPSNTILADGSRRKRSANLLLSTNTLFSLKAPSGKLTRSTNGEWN